MIVCDVITQINLHDRAACAVRPSDALSVHVRVAYLVITGDCASWKCADYAVTCVGDACTDIWSQLHDPLALVSTVGCSLAPTLQVPCMWQGGLRTLVQAVARQ